MVVKLIPLMQFLQLINNNAPERSAVQIRRNGVGDEGRSGRHIKFKGVTIYIYIYIDL